jgi:hypothetical protein
LIFPVEDAEQKRQLFQDPAQYAFFLHQTNLTDAICQTQPTRKNQWKGEAARTLALRRAVRGREKQVKER